MKAMIRGRYGPPEVLAMREVDKPVPGERSVLIEVRAASLNRSDWEGLIGKPLYARIGGMSPTLGTDVAGVVEAVGSQVERFRPGDAVFGDIMYHGGKAFAAYVEVPESAPLVLKPPGLSFVEASTLPQAGVIALQGMGRRVKENDRVLVNGGGGGTGAFAIQMAKNVGAEVTGVDNGHKLQFMSSLGADHVIDYETSDYTRSGSYDLILDLVCHRSMFAIRRAVAPGGRYSVVGGSVPALLSAATLARLLATEERTMGVLMVRPKRDDLSELADQVVSGTLKTTVDRTYSLEELPLALQALGEGRVLGKVVVEMS
ncbi:MAG TPA: NAD(P)-dependent alcohol dehydrogenase [Acidimicrobiia bacterium]|nr:NAD(P)-dependent alcohol dehydrogenase [Acidimicrobiia bacterium]